MHKDKHSNKISPGNISIKLSSKDFQRIQLPLEASFSQLKNREKHAKVSKDIQSNRRTILMTDDSLSQMDNISKQKKHIQSVIEINAKAVPSMNTQEDQSKVSIRDQTIKPTHREETMNIFRFPSYDEISPRKSNIKSKEHYKTIFEGVIIHIAVHCHP